VGGEGPNGRPCESQRCSAISAVGVAVRVGGAVEACVSSRSDMMKACSAASDRRPEVCRNSCGGLVGVSLAVDVVADRATVATGAKPPALSVPVDVRYKLVIAATSTVGGIGVIAPRGGGVQDDGGGRVPMRTSLSVAVRLDGVDVAVAIRTSIAGAPGYR